MYAAELHVAFCFFHRRRNNRLHFWRRLVSEEQTVVLCYRMTLLPILTFLEPVNDRHTCFVLWVSMSSTSVIIDESSKQNDKYVILSLPSETQHEISRSDAYISWMTYDALPSKTLQKLFI